jgi:hypothetical protein
MLALARELRSRRQFLKGAAFTSVGLAMMPSISTGASLGEAQLDLSKPADLLATSVKMRGTLDERLAFIWLRGLRYTLIDGEAVALCGYLGGSITRYRQLAEDTFEFLLYEISYYTDIQTGQILKTLRMPHTGKEVDVPLYRTGPGRHVLMVSNAEEMDWSEERTTSKELAQQLAPDGKIFYTFNLRPDVQSSGNTWIRSDSFTRLVPHDPKQAKMFYKEAITYQARTHDLLKPDVAQVDSTISFAIATAFRPWMEMAGVNGHTVTDGVGGKVLDMQQMPDDFIRFTAEHHPDVLENPAALLNV